eukprot:COSAG01_NODE_776_length_13693_cov_79.900029_4_plen_57_part_00
MLPYWQRLSTEQRNVWIVNCYWLQVLGYLLPYWLYANRARGGAIQQCVQAAAAVAC